MILSCNKETNKPEKEQEPKAQVSVTKIKEGTIPDYFLVTGKTIYLNKNTIVAPISGYVTKVNVHEGDRVSKGRVLFEMQSPEAYVMRENDSLKSSYGVIKIYAPVSGVVSGLNVVQKGVFADQGSVFCLIIASGDLKIQIEIPFEFRKYVQIGKQCEIILPDNSVIKSNFSKILPKMNIKNQTMKVLANLRTKTFIPENMIVKVRINRGKKRKAQILPKTCLMTNALMSEFWIMKVINDSTAVKVAVKIGNQSHSEVEILSPEFENNDKIVSQGAYGLADTALIKILN